MTEDRIVSTLAGHKACRSQREVRACTALIAEAVAEERRKIVRAFCPEGADHVLDNGRVWGFCVATALIGKGFTEDDIAAALRAPEGARP